jgi:hypothetical protein
MPTFCGGSIAYLFPIPVRYSVLIPDDQSREISMRWSNLIVLRLCLVIAFTVAGYTASAQSFGRIPDAHFTVAARMRIDDKVQESIALFQLDCTAGDCILTKVVFDRDTIADGEIVLIPSVETRTTCEGTLKVQSASPGIYTVQERAKQADWITSAMYQFYASTATVPYSGVGWFHGDYVKKLINPAREVVIRFHSIEGDSVRLDFRCSKLRLNGAKRSGGLFEW